MWTRDLILLVSKSVLHVLLGSFPARRGIWHLSKHISEEDVLPGNGSLEKSWKLDLQRNIKVFDDRNGNHQLDNLFIENGVKTWCARSIVATSRPDLPPMN